MRLRYLHYFWILLVFPLFMLVAGAIAKLLGTTEWTWHKILGDSLRIAGFILANLLWVWIGALLLWLRDVLRRRTPDKRD